MSSSSLFTISGLSFGYGTTPVLKGIDVDLAEGKFYGIVGPNGCGKTTLLDLLTGSKNPQSGTIHLFDKVLSSYPKRDLARHLALVPQDFDTGFGFTVEEIVLMGRHPHIDRFASPTAEDWLMVEKAMEQIGISDLRHRLTTTLSGGQKQRAIVARALAQDTPVLLLDEATSNLDIQYTLQIFNIARQLVSNEGRTVIAVVHNLNLAAAYCDHVFFVKNGVIARQGNIAEAMSAETIKMVFGVDSRIDWNAYNQSYQVSFQYQDM